MVVRANGRTSAVPLYFAERIIELEGADVATAASERRFRLGDTYLAVRRLVDHLGQASSGDDSGPVLVLRIGDQRLLLQVDAVLAQEEIVVKNMGDLLTGHPLFAGVTVRGDGDLVLILDIPALLDKATGRVREAQTVDATDISEVHTDAEAVPAAPVPAPVVQAAPQQVRVLFVDDSLSVRKVAEKTLTSLGVSVTLANDGVDALAKLRESKFDLVFTDLEMPRMHGYDLIRELRFLPAHKNLPIVVISSRSAQKHQDQARAFGANDYIGKPFTAQVLDATIKRLVSNPDAGKPREIKIAVKGSDA
jgi:chemosensory pili system protein ChpA (sensor histidine kinase/response regulator)